MCDDGYSGEACTTVNEYIGQCDPKCLGGCTGSTARDCMMCVPGAQRNHAGECECQPYQTGDDCGLAGTEAINCDPRCSGCVGPSNTECIACTRHAS